MKPMLAKRYKKGIINYPCYVQPKLNGVRALWLGDKLQSRSYGREESLIWDSAVLPHIHEALAQFPKCYFDGELYVHGWSLQKVNSCARVTSHTPHKNSHLLNFNIFDLISDEPFFNRWEKLEALAEKLKPPLFLVDTTFCHIESFGDMCYRNWKADGFEGMIYRDLNAHYGFEHNCPNQENRWSCLIKRKERSDMECECIGVEMSEKFTAIKVPHIKSLQLRTDKGIVFNGGGGLSHEEKIRFVDHPPLGCLVRISFDSLSEDFKPLQPSIEVIYV
jgi:ATP-dependent DNA ligase